MTTDLLTEAAVRPFLRGRLGAPYTWLAECTSTQDVLRGTDAPEGAIVVTEHQTAGRGRAGRVWEDGTSRAILASVLLRPEPTTEVAQLSLVVGLAVAEAMEALAGRAAMVKWPNDVIIDDRKVAGILLEADSTGVVCGIGVNVNQAADELPGNTSLPAGSLALVTGDVHDRAPLLAAILATLEERYDTWRALGLGSLLPALEARNWLRGRPVATGVGNGIAGDLTADGRLQLELPDGTTIAVGSTEIVPA